VLQARVAEGRTEPRQLQALERPHPATHERLFLNLSQTEGLAVAISVQAFIDRLEAMARGEGGHGAEGPTAAELLARRGLTSTVIGQARDLLAKLATVENADEPLSVEEQQAEQARAE
jgi:hypothetical protein